MHRLLCLFIALFTVACAAPALSRAGDAPSPSASVVVHEDENQISIETDLLKAAIRKNHYVSGIAAGSFIDKTTGVHDLGFGLHIMDFLLAPGWADDAYSHDPKVHGNLAKHLVEGPQICTQAGQLHPQIVRGPNFVAVSMRWTYTQPAPGFNAGSTWEQTLIFQPGVRYILSAEQITSANDVDDLFYRLDMPGHVRHKGADTFAQVYLSYRDELIPAAAFDHPFAPDERFLYQRSAGAAPSRMIRAYQIKKEGKAGPWLAGMTLDPAEVSEAWCHERGYVCFIEELHRRHVHRGEKFGAAYVIGYFDDIPQMQKVYDANQGATGIEVTANAFRLVGKK